MFNRECAVCSPYTSLRSCLWSTRRSCKDWLMVVRRPGAQSVGTTPTELLSLPTLQETYRLVGCLKSLGVEWETTRGSITEWECNSVPYHGLLRFAFVLCCTVVKIWTPTSWVALVAQLVERSPRLQSAVGLNPTQGSSSAVLRVDYWFAFYSLPPT